MSVDGIQMKITKLILNTIFIVSTRIGIQYVKDITYPDSIKVSKKWRRTIGNLSEDKKNQFYSRHNVS